MKKRKEKKKEKKRKNGGRFEMACGLGLIIVWAKEHIAESFLLLFFLFFFPPSSFGLFLLKSEHEILMVEFRERLVCHWMSAECVSHVLSEESAGTGSGHMELSEGTTSYRHS